MANPDPEIGYDDAKDARDDTVIMATGRSDYPNQVNNVLGFPFIFRGALDVRATEINEEMKVAAAEALAELPARTSPTPSSKPTATSRSSSGPTTSSRSRWTPCPVRGDARSRRGRHRLRVARTDTDVDMDAYVEELEARLGKSREMMRVVLNKARTTPNASSSRRATTRR